MRLPVQKLPLTFQPSVENHRVQQKEIKKSCYNRQIFSTQLLEMSCRLEDTLSLDCNADILERIIKSAVDRNIVKKQIKESSITGKWFTTQLGNTKSAKFNVYKIAKLVDNEEKWNEYRKIRNKYKYEINKAKKNYIKNRIRNTYNQKEMWRQIKTLVLKQNFKKIEVIYFNETRCTSNREIANKFHEYFISSIQEIVQSIEHVPYTNCIQTVEKTFVFKEITN